MKLNPFTLLLNQIIDSNCINGNDRVVIKDLITSLNLNEVNNYEDVNEKIKLQVELEATIVYLLSKYKKIFNDLKIESEEEDACALINIPKKNGDGYKLSINELKAYQLVNVDASLKRRKYRDAQLLIDTLQEISIMIFGRNKKLCELSINYRIESKADKDY